MREERIKGEGRITVREERINGGGRITVREERINGGGRITVSTCQSLLTVLHATRDQTANYRFANILQNFRK